MCVGTDEPKTAKSKKAPYNNKEITMHPFMTAYCFILLCKAFVYGISVLMAGYFICLILAVITGIIKRNQRRY